MKKPGQIRRGDNVRILINHHTRSIKPTFFQKDGLVCNVRDKGILRFDVMVMGVGMESFKETELERII